MAEPFKVLDGSYGFSALKCNMKQNFLVIFSLGKSSEFSTVGHLVWLWMDTAQQNCCYFMYSNSFVGPCPVHGIET